MATLCLFIVTTFGLVNWAGAAGDETKVFTGEEKYLFLDMTVKAPKEGKPDKEVFQENFHMALYKVNNPVTQDCDHKLFVVSFLSPSKVEHPLISGKTACLVGSDGVQQGVPLDHVFKISGNKIVYKSSDENDFFRMTVEWNEEKHLPKIYAEYMIGFVCDNIDDVPLEDM